MAGKYLSLLVHYVWSLRRVIRRDGHFQRRIRLCDLGASVFQKGIAHAS